jgi:hypothetical protein
MPLANGVRRPCAGPARARSVRIVPGGTAAWPMITRIFAAYYPMSPSLLLETDVRDKVLKRAFRAAARVVAEQDFKDDGYLCTLWRVQLSNIFLAPPCRARLVRYVSLPHKIKLGAKRHWD